MVVVMNQDQRPRSTYEWPRRTEWRQGIPDFHPGFVGMPASLVVAEALDPTVLAARLKLFEVEHDQVFESARREVEAGYKNDDWIWSVFPQAADLPEHFGKSSSDTSRKFSILCFDEAVAFLEHPILGSHYLTIVEAVRNQLDKRGLKEIFNRPGRRDAKKVVSSVTLFRRAARVCGIGSVLLDEEPRTATRRPTEAERQHFKEVFGNFVEQERLAAEKEKQDNPFGTNSAAVAPREFVSPLGGVLIDHCDVILAKADNENIEPCSYSQEFDRWMENQFRWRLDGVSGVPPFIPYDDESGGALDPRPWRGDAWCS